MDLYAEWKLDETRTLKAFYDSSYETVGSYAYDTEEETRAAEQEELSKLESEEWVALYIVLYRVCPECEEIRIVDDLGGCVVENDRDAVYLFAIDALDFSEETE
jgi:hypothetical protein